MSGEADLDEVRREIEAIGRRAILAPVDVRDRPAMEAALAELDEPLTK